jgi:hypothetical protein
MCALKSDPVIRFTVRLSKRYNRHANMVSEEPTKSTVSVHISYGQTVFATTLPAQDRVDSVPVAITIAKRHLAQVFSSLALQSFFVEGVKIEQADRTLTAVVAYGSLVNFPTAFQVGVDGAQTIGDALTGSALTIEHLLEYCRAYFSNPDTP